MTQSAPLGKIEGEWPLVPLPEIVFYQEGPGLRKWQWTGSGMKVVNGKNILTDGRLDLSNTSRYIAMKEFEDRYRHFAVEQGDIIVSSSGTIGKVARIGQEHLPLMMNTSVIRFHPRSDSELDADYLHAFLRSPLFQAQAETYATGAAQRNFGPMHLKQMHVPVPPLPIQRKIASVLSAYDDLIANNTRRIEILEEMARAIYREWFVEFRYPGHEGVPLVESELGPIPEGWGVRTVRELGAGPSGVVGGPFGSKLGRKDYVEAGVPVIRGTNLHGLLGFSYDDLVFVSEEKFLDLKGNGAAPGDILVTQRGTLGQVGLIPESSPYSRFVVSQSQMRFRVDGNETETVFVFYALRSPSVNKRLVDHAMSAGVPHINLAILREFRLVVPPLGLASDLGLVRPARRLIEVLSQQNGALVSARDLLLPRLVSGEVDVSDLDIDVGVVV